MSQPSKRVPGLVSNCVDLQSIGREDLNTSAIEEPRRIVRSIGRLIGPVLEVVVGEQADIGHEDAHVEVDAVQAIPVIAGVGFVQITIDCLQIELTAECAEVVARDDRGAGAELQEVARSCSAMARA
jgi:hypothetical protein